MPRTISDRDSPPTLSSGLVLDGGEHPEGPVLRDGPFRVSANVETHPSTRLNFLNIREPDVTGAGDWIGRVGDVWADEWRRTDRSLADLSRHLDAAILAAAPAGPFRALDIGCGAGATSLALAAARPDAEIVGVDLSEPLVAVARRRFVEAGLLPSLDREGPGVGGLPQAITLAEGDPPPSPPPSGRNADSGRRITLRTGDALDLATAHAPFDLLYSRHGVMFFDDPVAAFAALRRAARPGARLVFSCFRDWHANAFAHAVADAVGGSPPEPGPGPFAFADHDTVAAILHDAGWRAATATSVDFTYRAGAGEDPVGDALAFLQRIGPAAAVLRTRPEADRPALLDRLRAVLVRYRTDDGIDFPAAAWLWSATA